MACHPAYLTPGGASGHLASQIDQTSSGKCFENPDLRYHVRHPVCLSKLGNACRPNPDTSGLATTRQPPESNARSHSMIPESKVRCGQSTAAHHVREGTPVTTLCQS